MVAEHLEVKKQLWGGKFWNFKGTDIYIHSRKEYKWGFNQSVYIES